MLSCSRTGGCRTRQVISQQYEADVDKLDAFDDDEHGHNSLAERAVILGTCQKTILAQKVSNPLVFVD